MLANRHVLVLLFLLGCRRTTPLVEALHAAVEVRPGTVLVVEKKASIVRYLETEQIPFEEVWTPPARAVAFLDAAVPRFLDAHPPEPDNDADLKSQSERELSTLRENLRAYVRECAGIVVAGKRQIVCQLVLRHPAAGKMSMSEARSFTTTADGGCGVFHVVADATRREILRFECNGAT
jgi:hypothetical protein